MSKKTTEEIKASIKHLTYQINLLKSKVDSSEESSKMYNRLIIQRACLRKKLSDSQTKGKLLNLFRNIKFSKQEKRICDYFPSK